MPPATIAFYNTVKEVVKYCVENKLPLLGICQGFQVILQAFVDLYEPKGPEHDGPEEDFRRQIRDGILSDTRMFGQFRTTKWTVENPGDLHFLKQIPKETVEYMATGQGQIHYHNWVVKLETFKECKSLTDFFHIVAVDDATPQGMNEEECKDFKEFVLIVEGKNHPINAWLTHPESSLTKVYHDK